MKNSTKVIGYIIFSTIGVAAILWLGLPLYFAPIALLVGAVFLGVNLSRPSASNPRTARRGVTQRPAPKQRGTKVTDMPKEGDYYPVAQSWGIQHDGYAPAETHRVSDILNWNVKPLEDRHNYIQLFFPINKLSGTPYRACLATPAQVEAFKEHVHNDGKKDFKAATLKMLKFWGFKARFEGDNLVVEPYHPDPNDDSQHASLGRTGWQRLQNRYGRLFRGKGAQDHNYRRISRIIESLTLLGYPQWAVAFAEALETPAADNKGAPLDRVPAKTSGIWRGLIEQARAAKRAQAEAGQSTAPGGSAHAPVALRARARGEAERAQAEAGPSAAAGGGALTPAPVRASELRAAAPGAPPSAFSPAEGQQSPSLAADGGAGGAAPPAPTPTPLPGK